jgi:hypothetical protein
VTRIPIDMRAPIACTAGREEIADRIEQIGFMRDRVRSIDRTPTGIVLWFDNDPSLLMRLEQFAADEKGCCKFWGFDLTEAGDRLTLAWDGPPSVQELLDELDQIFRSDAPLTALSGLL